MLDSEKGSILRTNLLSNPESRFLKKLRWQYYNIVCQLFLQWPLNFDRVIIFLKLSLITKQSFTEAEKVPVLLRVVVILCFLLFLSTACFLEGRRAPTFLWRATFSLPSRGSASTLCCWRWGTAAAGGGGRSCGTRRCSCLNRRGWLQTSLSGHMTHLWSRQALVCQGSWVAGLKVTHRPSNSERIWTHLRLLNLHFFSNAGTP